MPTQPLAPLPSIAPRLPRAGELVDPRATLAVLAAVRQHPLLMSPVLLEYLLRGEVVGRMREKGLEASAFRGALDGLPPAQVTLAIAGALERGEVQRASGTYQALTLTEAGERRVLTLQARQHLAIAPVPAQSHPADPYSLYYAWRKAVARSLCQPPYRVATNALLAQLAELRPTSLDQLLAVPGLGKRRALRHQHALLDLGRQLDSAR